MVQNWEESVQWVLVSNSYSWGDPSEQDAMGVMHAVLHRRCVQIDELLCLPCCELEAAFQTLGPSVFHLVVCLPDLWHVSPSSAPADGCCRWAPVSCYSHDISWMLKSKNLRQQQGLMACTHPVQPARSRGLRYSGSSELLPHEMCRKQDKRAEAAKCQLKAICAPWITLGKGHITCLFLKNEFQVRDCWTLGKNSGNSCKFQERRSVKTTMWTAHTHASVPHGLEHLIAWAFLPGKLHSWMWWCISRWAWHMLIQSVDAEQAVKFGGGSTLCSSIASCRNLNA